jgi:hypothetical protein
LRPGRVVPREGVEIPAREHAGQTADGFLRVGVGGHAVAQAAVRGQFYEADGKELQHFARVVLVGHAAGQGVFLLVAAHVEVHAHAG